MPTRFLTTTTAIGAILAMTVPVATLANEAQPIEAMQGDADFARFAPASATAQTTLDWAEWDAALDWFVLNMGPSLREYAPRRYAAMGTRFVWGHTSPYRMEGNRVAFQFMEDKQRAALTEYRQDLERIGSEIDVASLPRNEQLAFWINLHNVAVIEQVALAYPVMTPRKVAVGGVPLDEAKFIRVAGVAMSPKDIRTKIVYPNWDDPRVIYGFFRGEIGGPSIARRAYTGREIAGQLALNAAEFVNALRGVDASGETLKVSTIYDEARPFFFASGDTALRAHLAKYAGDEVKAALTKTSRIDASLAETDIADLSKGEREPAYSLSDECPGDPVESGGKRPGFKEPGSCPRRSDVPLAVQRFEEERSVKIEKLIREGKIGTVTVLAGTIGEDSDEVD